MSIRLSSCVSSRDNQHLAKAIRTPSSSNCNLLEELEGAPKPPTWTPTLIKQMILSSIRINSIIYNHRILKNTKQIRDRN